MELEHFKVALFTSAWIETFAAMGFCSATTSRSSRARGLKHDGCNRNGVEAVSRSSRARGLKQEVVIVNALMDWCRALHERVD